MCEFSQHHRYDSQKSADDSHSEEAIHSGGPGRRGIAALVNNGGRSRAHRSGRCLCTCTYAGGGIGRTEARTRADSGPRRLSQSKGCKSDASANGIGCGGYKRFAIRQRSFGEDVKRGRGSVDVAGVCGVDEGNNVSGAWFEGNVCYFNALLRRRDILGHTERSIECGRIGVSDNDGDRARIIWAIRPSDFIARAVHPVDIGIWTADSQGD